MMCSVNPVTAQSAKKKTVWDKLKRSNIRAFIAQFETFIVSLLVVDWNALICFTC